MKVLFIHQNFPGQYVHIVQRLSHQGGHQLVALGINQLDQNRELPSDLKYFRYPLRRGNGEGVHPLVVETESKDLFGRQKDIDYLDIPSFLRTQAD